MSSSFPQFSVDEIILRHGSQDLYYFMIIHRSITLNTATPGAHFIILLIVLLTDFIFYISLRCLQRFPEPFSGNFWNNCSVNWNFPEHYSVTFRNSRTASRKFPVYRKTSFWNSGFPEPIMEMEKISRSFPYINRNPEFRWKPYSRVALDLKKNA